MKFLSSVPSLNLLKSHSNHCPDSAGDFLANHELRDNEINTATGEAIKGQMNQNFDILSLAILKQPKEILLSEP